MIRDTAILLVELVVLFFAVTVLVQLLQRRMGSERVRVWLGGHPVSAALKGIAIGFVTPFCTFTAVPMLIGLRQARVPSAGLVAFIVAAPILDPVLFGALVLIAGFDTAVIYLLVAFMAAVLLALAAEVFTIDRHLKPIPSVVPPSGCGDRLECDSSDGDSFDCDSPDGDRFDCDSPDGGRGPEELETWSGLGQELRPASTAAVRLLRSMGPLLLLGVAISLVIDATVSPDITAGLTNFSPAIAIPVAAALGTPLYVSTAVFVPVADSLQGAGVGMGSIVALTIAGAGVNLPEFVILTKLARPALVGVFFCFVFAVAVVGGFVAHVVVA